VLAGAAPPDRLVDQGRGGGDLVIRPAAVMSRIFGCCVAIHSQPAWRWVSRESRTGGLGSTKTPLFENEDPLRRWTGKDSARSTSPDNRFYHAWIEPKRAGGFRTICPGLSKRFDRSLNALVCSSNPMRAGSAWAQPGGIRTLAIVQELQREVRHRRFTLAALDVGAGLVAVRPF
jgi:hypothetical protein